MQNSSIAECGMRIGKDGTARLPIAVEADDRARRRAALAWRGSEILRCVAGPGPGMGNWMRTMCGYVRLCSLNGKKMFEAPPFDESQTR